MLCTHLEATQNVFPSSSDRKSKQTDMLEWICIHRDTETELYCVIRGTLNYMHEGKLNTHTHKHQNYTIYIQKTDILMQDIRKYE